jgi:hypothetical protein
MVRHKAFDNLKVAMTRTPVLALPNFQKTFIVETDACQDGIGAILMEKSQPIAEFLALIIAVEKWRHYHSN